MRENIRSIYILLFLTVAFYFLQMQDPQRYQQLFALERGAVMQGELWRLFTFQFLSGSPIWLFFELLILWIMGSAIEEELGTARFLAFYLIANFVTAGVGLALGVPLLGSYFGGMVLLFAFASRFPEHVFYIFFVLPVKVKWLALISLGMAFFGALRGSAPAISALAGAGAGMGFLLYALGDAGRLIRQKVRRAPLRQQAAQPAPPRQDRGSEGNVARFREARRLAEESPESIDESIARFKPHVTPGVNICPPADFKPEAEDQFCARCEGFSECSIRWLTRKKDEGQSSERSGG